MAAAAAAAAAILHNIVTEEPPPPPAAEEEVPLIAPQEQEQEHGSESEEEEVKDTQLDEALERLETFLCFFGFHQSTVMSCIISWVTFLLIGVAVPVATLKLSSCSGCEKYQINDFELDILVSQVCLAAVSLLCVSHNLRKRGLRRFLFVDRYHGYMMKFRNEYIEKIEGFFRLLALWILPCLLLKTIREVLRIAYVPHESWYLSLVILIAMVFSWTFLTIVSLSACFLFNLVCNLQVIHFDDYAKLLESDSDVSVFMGEHIRLRHYLSKISHRFRIYLLVEFFVVTASQVVTLFRTTGYQGIITFLNDGDFAMWRSPIRRFSPTSSNIPTFNMCRELVSSIVQVVGISLCLQAAARISHRAQGVASVASRWHALVTCNSTDGSRLRHSKSAGNFLAINQEASISKNYSDSDLESLDGAALPSYIRVSSYTSSYNKRQAFVMYLQMNPGGVTIFGWTVDRSLINTIFFIELSLVLFVLGKTVMSPIA